MLLVPGCIEPETASTFFNQQPDPRSCVNPDVATGENWSVYFRVVNTKAHKASPYYIVDLSPRPPLIIMVDSLDVGSGVRRREVWDETVQSHDDVTEQVLAKLLDRAADEA